MNETVALMRPRLSGLGERLSPTAGTGASLQYFHFELFGISEQLARPAPWPVLSGGIRP